MPRRIVSPPPPGASGPVDQVPPPPRHPDRVGAAINTRPGPSPPFSSHTGPPRLLARNRSLAFAAAPHLFGARETEKPACLCLLSRREEKRIFPTHRIGISDCPGRWLQRGFGPSGDCKDLFPSSVPAFRSVIICCSVDLFFDTAGFSEEPSSFCIC